MPDPKPSPAAMLPGDADGPGRSFLLTTRRFENLSEHVWRDADHEQDELLWSGTGVLRVRAADQLWTIPAQLGLWIPAGVRHTIEVSSDSVLHGTFVALGATPTLPREPVAVGLPPVIRELLHHNADAEMPAERRLRLQRLALDLITPVPSAHVDLTLPQSPRLLRVAQAILDDPADSRSTEHWAALAGLTPRHLAAGFRAETGHSPTQWRIHARVRASLILLGSGLPVVAVARRLGYASASTFIDHFRTIVGSTPVASLSSRD